MNGKELKVVDYNLTFGGKERKVNVYGFFRYQKNNSLYVIYNDTDVVNNFINYGTSHIKGESILSMTPKDTDEEIIKEYIFKITNNEQLDGFEILSLETINSIEIISSNKLELKKDALEILIDKTIPKKVITEQQPKPKKKKSPAKKLLAFLIILLIAAGGAYYYLKTMEKDESVKTIICKKTTSDRTLNATIDETVELNFNYKDILETTNTTKVYKFNSKNSYEDFINKGTMYKYMPENENDGGFSQDDNNNSFTIFIKSKITSSYDKPTNYEESLSYNKREGYQCEEKLIEE